MTVRLSTTQVYQQSIDQILQQQNRLLEIDLKIASGKRILKPSDDPSAAVRILNFDTEIGNIEQFGNNIDAARTHLSQQEDILKQVGNNLQRIRELMVQANNDTLDASNRGAIGTEVESIREQLLSLANTRDAAGEYIFAGNQVSTQPFTESAGLTTYNGDEGKRLIQIANGIRVQARVSGEDVFRSIRSGNGTFEVVANAGNQGDTVVKSSSSGQFVTDTYNVNFIQALPTDPVTFEVRDGGSALVTSGAYVSGDAIEFNGVRLNINGTAQHGDNYQVSPATEGDLFSMINTAMDALSDFADNQLNKGLLHNRLNQTMDNMDQSISHVLDHRASIGARLNSLENQQDVHANNVLYLKESQASLQDLDYAEAINEMNMRLVALQAAQQAYIKIQDMSIFNYL